jgi:hypothetical protein
MMSDPVRALIDKWRTWATNEKTKRDLGSDLYAEAVLTCADELASVLSSVPQGWQPIDARTPANEVLWFWVRPKKSEEAYMDSGGNSIFRAGPPRVFTGKYKTWSALETADYWMWIPWPVPPDLLLPAPQKEP